MIDSERPIELDDGAWHKLSIIVEDTIVIVYLDGVAMSARMYDYREGGFGIYCNECGASFKDIRLYR